MAPGKIHEGIDEEAEEGEESRKQGADFEEQNDL
jgi:hypothetical protein